MNLVEASFFYNDFSQLFQELRELELSEIFDCTLVPEEFSACNTPQ